MTSSGAHKAALLLMNLDTPTAAELLKSLEPEAVTEIAAELAYLNNTGAPPEDAAESVEEFSRLLERSFAAGPGGPGALRQLVQSALGEQKGREVFGQVQKLLETRDPFKDIRSADVEDIAAALRGESAPVVAMVLSELPESSSAKLLGMLDEDIRAQAVRGMASGMETSLETKVRVATAVRRRLSGSKSGGSRGPDKYRKVAVLLRELGTDSRANLLKALTEQDPDGAEAVKRQMVLWEDLVEVSDRSMQDAVREIDSRTLALALVGSQEATLEKIRQNMSERAAAMLDEESQLLSTPSDEEVTEAREKVLQVFHELLANAMLTFERT